MDEIAKSQCSQINDVDISQKKTLALKKSSLDPDLVSSLPKLKMFFFTVDFTQCLDNLLIVRVYLDLEYS